MDPFALAFYAVICGALSLAAPSLGQPLVRVGLGAGVGIVAAAALPTLRATFGL